MTVAVRIEPVGYEVARGRTYTLTPDKFRSGIVVSDALAGVDYMIGETLTGAHVRAALNVPLCDGCDQPVPANGVCDGCECIHADIAERIEPARHILTERARLGRAA